MFRPEVGSGTNLDYVPPKPGDINQELDKVLQTPMSERYGQSALAYGAEAKRMNDFGRQQIADNNLPDVTLTEGNDKFSDAPANAPVLDSAGRVESIQYADGTTREYTYKDGQVATYKDRDGHTWAFTAPDEWKQQDGTSILHGEMIVEKDGSFTFINHDKDYVSHYGADGAENVGARKDYAAYTHEQLIALDLAGKQFAATGLPQDSLEKPKQAAGAEPIPQLEPASVQPETRPEPDTKLEPASVQPETRPEPDTKLEPASVQPETRPEPDTKLEPASVQPETRPEPDTKLEPAAVHPETRPEPATKPESAPVQPETKPGQQSDAITMPLTPPEVQAFAQNFGVDPAEVARIDSLTLEQVRAEMQKTPQLERISSQKYRFYGEMVYRLTDCKSSSAYSNSDLT